MSTTFCKHCNTEIVFNVIEEYWFHINGRVINHFAEPSHLPEDFKKIEPELRPCPFCGGKAEIEDREYGRGPCCIEDGEDCDVEIIIGYEKEDVEQAVKQWNRRAK